MDIFDELSFALSPNPKAFLLKQRIKILEQSVQDYMTIIHDIETQIETLKKQLHDTDKPSKNHPSTIVDGDDIPPFSFV